MAVAAAEKPEGASSFIDPEALRVRSRRFKEAKRAGLTRIEATLFAESTADVGYLRIMVKGHATPDQICRVLL